MITNTVIALELVKREEQKKAREERRQARQRKMLGKWARKNDWSAGQHADQDEITRDPAGSRSMATG